MGESQQWKLVSSRAVSPEGIREDALREPEAQQYSWGLSETREETKLEAEVTQSLTYGNRLVFAPGRSIFTTCVSNLVMQENFA